MVKKYKKSCEVWLRSIKSHLKQGKDGIDAIVKDALYKLDKHEHIKFKSQTAILAFKCGVPDTGLWQVEMLNVWVAYLNLENEYGNPPKEAVAKVFKEALQYCDREKFHLALLGVYEKNDQYKLADELLDQMMVWLRRIKSHLKQGKDGIGAIVNDALHKLDKHVHIKFKSQTAILAFKGGVPDTGRSMNLNHLFGFKTKNFLEILHEIRLDDEEVIRALFERATSLSLSSKNMKSLFKKYLEYEKGHGDEDRVEYVKRNAIECVENSLA
ncbi:hypothetical protein IFM89_007587 [Coptis chinensis]|uniref:Uncharacterized protein n=1 Tax=Coptis chinensis TaxID=261450 RepID=A0A835GWH7_9MAGN|nr:hypothetical protein IFM89_007587 [Coptis chinensis]